MSPSSIFRLYSDDVSFRVFVCPCVRILIVPVPDEIVPANIRTGNRERLASVKLKRASADREISGHGHSLPAWTEYRRTGRAENNILIIRYKSSSVSMSGLARCNTPSRHDEEKSARR